MLLCSLLMLDNRNLHNRLINIILCVNSSEIKYIVFRLTQVYFNVKKAVKISSKLPFLHFKKMEPALI